MSKGPGVQRMFDGIAGSITTVAGKRIEDADMILETESKLFDVVRTLQPPSRIPSRLNGGQQ